MILLWATIWYFAVLVSAQSQTAETIGSQRIKHIVTRDDLKNHQKIAQQELLNEMRKTHLDTKLELTVADLEALVHRDVLTGVQAKKLWDALLDKQEPTNPSDFYEFHDAMFLGIFSVVSLFYGLGSIVIISIYGFTIRVAFSEKSGLVLVCSSAVFASVFYAAAFALHYSYNSGLIAGCLFLVCNLALLALLHGILVLFGQASMDIGFDDIIPIGKYKLKIFACLVNLGISYYFSLICCFPIVQVPFYCSLSYLAGMIGMTLHFAMPLTFAPFCIHVMTYYGLGLLWYLSTVQGQAFKLSLLPAVARVDFRVVGYLTSLLILSWSVPLLISVQYFGDHEAFRSSFICFPTIKQKWLNPEYKGAGPRHWCLKEIWSFVYFGFSVASVVYGVYSSCWAIIVASQVFVFLALSSLPHSDEYFPDKTLYPLLYAILLVIPMILEDVEDISETQVSLFFRDSLLWSAFIWSARVFCALLAAYGTATAQHLTSM